MNWWDSADTLNRIALWLMVATFVTPVIFGLSALVVQNRGKRLEDESLDRLREANRDLAHELGQSRQQVRALEVRVAPWTLSTHQEQVLRTALQDVRAKAYLACRLLDAESCGLAATIAGILSDLAWEVHGPANTSLNSFIGISVFSNTKGENPLHGQRELFAALQSVGLPCHGTVIEPNSVGGVLPEEAIFVIVGRKPL